MKLLLLFKYSFCQTILFRCHFLLSTAINICLFFFLLPSSLSFHFTQISGNLFPSVGTPFLLFGTKKLCERR